MSFLRPASSSSFSIKPTPKNKSPPSSIYIVRFWKFSLPTLIHSRYGCVLSGNVTSSCFCILNEIWNFHLFPLIINWIPVSNRSHSRISIAKFFTEISVNRIWVTTAMGIVKRDVEEERSENQKRKINIRKKIANAKEIEL